MILPMLLLAAALPEMTRINETNVAGRTAIRYEHTSLAEWQYPRPQRDYFYVVPPKNPGTGPAPLQVFLHSAGGGGESEMHQSLKIPHNPLECAATSYGLYLDCRQNQATDWWWGYHALEKAGARFKSKLGPTEKRVLATVEWVCQNFPIDRNRLQLVGVSMGGSGSLGIGLNHGDIFAAIVVLVPAGVGHAQWRLNSPGQADPPPVLNCSSQTDAWAAGQEKFIAESRARRYPFIFAWGPYGHGGRFAEYHPAAVEFPWRSIRKNVAYPVFTGATTDQTYPGLQNTTAPDQTGQINALFRWKTITDTLGLFAMELRLVRQNELSRPVELPALAVADVTIRRAQQFRMTHGRTYRWQSGEQSGRVQIGADGLLTLPRVSITATGAVLKIETE
ncbi:MAG: hypothetical protein PCFJNLEI_03842 [Verrucomicrobiae bacterium]|nr:hypothetical protein [Verrucomicrobiae bacterium]